MRDYPTIRNRLTTKADLFLIRPPKEALHTPVNPSDIVIAGDSAGGGLTISLLQILRDLDLPLPAGGIPISPWCDLTHSFPSIHTNTDNDIIPKYGLSMYRPSALWPPPPEDLAQKVRAGLRARIRETAMRIRDTTDGDGSDVAERPGFWRRKFSFKANGKSKARRSSSLPRSSQAEKTNDGDVRLQALQKSVSNTAAGDKHNLENNLDIGTTAPVPTADQTDVQTLSIVTESGEKIVVHDQVHLYTVNNLVTHPLVSPAYSYLGGLPPLLFIASDGEVLPRYDLCWENRTRQIHLHSVWVGLHYADE